MDNLTSIQQTFNLNRTGPTVAGATEAKGKDSVSWTYLDVLVSLLDGVFVEFVEFSCVKLCELGDKDPEVPAEQS